MKRVPFEKSPISLSAGYECEDIITYRWFHKTETAPLTKLPELWREAIEKSSNKYIDGENEVIRYYDTISHDIVFRRKIKNLQVADKPMTDERVQLYNELGTDVGRFRDKDANVYLYYKRGDDIRVFRDTENAFNIILNKLFAQVKRLPAALQDEYSNKVAAFRTSEWIGNNELM